MGRFIVERIMPDFAHPLNLSKKYVFCLLLFFSDLLQAKGKVEEQVILTGESFKAKKSELPETISFEVVRLGTTHVLRVRPLSSKNFCDLKVRKITAPQQLKGRPGIIQANKGDCQFQIKSSKLSSFWNEMILFDMTYLFIKGSRKILGEVTVSHLKKRFKGEVKMTLLQKEAKQVRKDR